MLARRALTSFVIGSLVVSVGFACSSSSESGGGGGGGGSSGDGGAAADAGTGTGGAGGSAPGTGGGGTGTGGYTGTGGIFGDGGLVDQLCGDVGCQCSNGIDDDGDGYIDGFDAECTGPLDNDEGTFATGIPGDNVDPKWQDCFFDGNSGAGDDGCRYHTDCLTGAKEQTHPDCVVSQECIDFCGGRTPNGCDCFGCCEIHTGTGTVNVVIGSTCSLEDIDDEEKCPRCQRTTQCGNNCGECELCPGKEIEDLPESCTPDVPDGGYPPDAAPPPTYTCEGGDQVCSASEPCPIGFYCSLGCCRTIIE